MCTHKEHEIATCENLLEALTKNGKCGAHETLVVGIAKANTGIKIIMWAIGGMITVTITLNMVMLQQLLAHAGK